MLRRARSYLFVPGHDERKLHRALASSADAIIADWEDSVPASQLADAYEIVRTVFAASDHRSPLRLVRLRSAADAERATAMGVDGVVLPKATPESARQAARAHASILALIETASGLATVGQTAAEPGVEGLMLGAIDLRLSLGLEERDDGQELLSARSKLVLESTLTGLIPPIDTVNVHIDDRPRLDKECQLARSLGFGAKACIHPAQIETVNAAFAQRDSDLAWARRVIAAAEEAAAHGLGAFRLEGQMIDRPVVVRARRLLGLEETPLTSTPELPEATTQPNSKGAESETRL